jgi:hypothetical protein
MDEGLDHARRAGANRDRLLLGLWDKGMTDEEIATHLGIGVDQVDTIQKLREGAIRRRAKGGPATPLLAIRGQRANRRLDAPSARLPIGVTGRARKTSLARYFVVWAWEA